jgi:hypothetical protein
MLVCLGYDVTLEMAEGPPLRAPRSAALLFDPSGIDWPFCSVLIRPFARDAEPAQIDGFTRDWYGAKYELRQGSIDLPPRALGQWREVGDSTRILYTRGSRDKRAAKLAGDYEHPFGKRGLFDVFTFSRTKLPVLYRRGGDLRLELGHRCAVTGRGFERP